MTASTSSADEARQSSTTSRALTSPACSSTVLAPGRRGAGGGGPALGGRAAAGAARGAVPDRVEQGEVGAEEQHRDDRGQQRPVHRGDAVLAGARGPYAHVLRHGESPLRIAAGLGAMPAGGILR